MDGRVEIRAIPAAETIELRWAVLRPGFPRETAIFPGDDAAGTLHLGVYESGRLVGVASLYDAELPEAPPSFGAKQLRGMATEPDARGRGYGRALLEACVDAATRDNCPLLWCNARVGAVDFYRKHGWEVCSGEFDIPTVGPHFRMRRLLGARVY